MTLLFLANLIIFTREKTVFYPTTSFLTFIFFMYDGYMLFSNANEMIVNLILIAYNLTTFEIMMQRRLPYMWKSYSMDFYNPFDKGIISNFKEICTPLCGKLCLCCCKPAHKPQGQDSNPYQQI